MKTLIKVKQSHITKALELTKLHSSKSRNCPIALALKEHFKIDDVIVGSMTCLINGGNGGSVDMPRSCRRFIVRFDSGKPVKPFNFFFKS